MLLQSISKARESAKEVHLIASVGGACYSRSQGFECEPHMGCGDYFKKKIKPSPKKAQRKN